MRQTTKAPGKPVFTLAMLTMRQTTKEPVFTLAGSSMIATRNELHSAGIPDDAQVPLRFQPHRYREVDVKEGWVQAPLSDEWMAAYRIVIQKGQPVIAELRILPREATPWRPGLWRGALQGPTATVPHGGLSARIVRRVRVGEHFRVGIEIMDALKIEGWTPAARDDRGSERRRMPNRSDAQLAEMARAYVEALTAGSRRPIRELALRQRTTVPAVRMAIYRARLAGLLTKPKQGSRGGELTPRCTRLLKRLVTKPPRKGGRK